MNISYPDTIPGIMRRKRLAVIDHNVGLSIAEIVAHYESIGLEYGVDCCINAASTSYGGTCLASGVVLINFFNDDAFIMAKMAGDDGY